MLSASTSMPWASIAAMRSDSVAGTTRSGRMDGSPIFMPTSAMASGTAQCACTSITFTRLPLTSVCLRRPCAWACPAPKTSQPTKATLAAKARKSLLAVMVVFLLWPQMYAVKEIFYTLQGEGINAGRPAVFLRFAGCNLWSGSEEDRQTAVCRFCDTQFVGTDGPGGGKFSSAQALAQRVGHEWPD